MYITDKLRCLLKQRDQQGLPPRISAEVIAEVLINTAHRYLDFAEGLLRRNDPDQPTLF